MTDEVQHADPAPAAEPWLQVLGSRYLTAWLAEQQVSIAFTTYQAGKLFLIGRKPDGGISGFERTFERTMGLWSDGQTMWLSSIYQIWRLQNPLLPGESADGYDRVFVPATGNPYPTLAPHRQTTSRCTRNASRDE